MKWTLSSRKRVELKEGNEAEVKGPGQIKIDLHKLIPKFDSKFDDISLFLISFERQAKNSELTKNMLGDTSDQYSTFGNCRSHCS
ncbi:hypothetical protein TNCV_2715801 [Trichonephila clavipes]|nr:hypothetical protein TNCV_2715801 [Trichonephila clavipes]